ncbi:MAG TPA: isocitrate/isopropylmalate family dehydrogenase [Holophagaceae bacterium]
MTTRLAVIPGDGIGPEVIEEVLPILDWARRRGRELQWDLHPWGADHFLTTGEILPEAAWLDLRDGTDAILFGAIGDPRIPDGRHAEGLLLRFRQDLELSINERPCKPRLDRHLPLKDRRAEEVSIEVFRENTEGPYCLKGTTEPGRGVDLAEHTEMAVRRLLEAAFVRSAERKRPLVLAHKANVLKHGHGLWMRIFKDLKARFPAVEAHSLHADALLCALVLDPRPFGVIAADNYLGDLISDLLAAFQGGMGVAPSLSWAPHRPYRCAALAEPVHGSAPDLAGRNLANPTGMFLSTALLFHHLGWAAEAETLEAAVEAALREGAATPDLGGRLGTRDMGAAIRARLPG